MGGNRRPEGSPIKRDRVVNTKEAMKDKGHRHGEYERR